MRFPGGNHLRRLKREFFPSSADIEAGHEARLAAISAQFDARRTAQEARDTELRRACADRLTPYIGRLFLVNNFKEVRVEENAARISTAVLAKLGVDVPIGVSAVLSSGRGNHESLVETADALIGALGSRVGERAVPLRPEHESSDLWLLSLARVPEAMARQTDLPPEGLGCIAVVSALDMNRQADIPGVPAPGAAFMLADVSEQGRFSWEIVALSPWDEGRTTA
ncbi:MAG TPA: hypothetical protein VLF40_03865 [Candidatus Saccharimonadales bacterium]|nr:hypothetical protein [Candidatus Saccharimonadales bacterium]